LKALVKPKYTEDKKSIKGVEITLNIEPEFVTPTEEEKNLSEFLEELKKRKEFTMICDGIAVKIRSAHIPKRCQI